MAYTNSQILSAVLSKFLQPLVRMYGGGRLASLPFVQALENKVKASGFVSGGWSLTGELSPIIEQVSGRLITPILDSYLSRINDAQLPAMAHSIVDAALENGKLSLLDGTIVFEETDLSELKRLLDINLPATTGDGYVVKEEPPENNTPKSEQQ